MIIMKSRASRFFGPFQHLHVDTFHVLPFGHEKPIISKDPFKNQNKYNICRTPHKGYGFFGETASLASKKVQIGSFWTIWTTNDQLGPNGPVAGSGRPTSTADQRVSSKIYKKGLHPDVGIRHHARLLL